MEGAQKKGLNVAEMPIGSANSQATGKQKGVLGTTALEASEPKDQQAKLEKNEMGVKPDPDVAELRARLSVLQRQATSQRKEENEAAAKLSDTLQVISTAEAASSNVYAKLKKNEMGAKQADPEVAELRARLSVLQQQATSQRKEENEAAAKLSDTLQAISKAEASAPNLKEQSKQLPKASLQVAKQTHNEDIDAADANAKGNKAVLKKLRQQLAEEERKLRQLDMSQSERKNAMQLETQLISDSIREIGTRCQMLVDKHRALLDDRKRLEAEA